MYLAFLKFLNLIFVGSIFLSAFCIRSLITGLFFSETLAGNTRDAIKQVRSKRPMSRTEVSDWSIYSYMTTSRNKEVWHILYRSNYFSSILMGSIAWRH